MSRTQQDAFVAAADRWACVIVGDLPDVVLDGEAIDDVLVLASGATIDGVGGTLGEAGPTHIRVGGAPCRGEMRFDLADLESMESEGILVDVITHEMGHVLGIGTLWASHGLIQDLDGPDPRYTGRVAMVEYGRLTGSHPEAVPVENQGGPGSRGSHWRDEVFRHELMTSAIGGVNNPISRMTVASLIDLGYQVDLEAAEPYTFPVPIEGAALTRKRLAGEFERPAFRTITEREAVESGS